MASDENQFVDLRMPKGNGPHALAIVHSRRVSGGRNTIWDIWGISARLLTAKGMATANLEYRRVGNAGGGWPGTFADVRAAYQFLMQNAREYEFDPRSEWW